MVHDECPLLVASSSTAFRISAPSDTVIQEVARDATADGLCDRRNRPLVVCEVPLDQHATAGGLVATPHDEVS